jgi:hypothetical protein
MAKNHVWYVCPACRSRLAVERNHTGEVRCRNCSLLIRPAKDQTASPSKNAATAQAADGDDDEYHLAPLEGRAPAAKAENQTADTSPPVYYSELERLRARREQVTQTGVPDAAPSAPRSGTLSLDDFEIRDDQRYKPAPPPRFTFFSGVFTYPWRPQSFFPWMVLSIGLLSCGFLGLLTAAGLNSGDRAGTVMAGFLGLAWIWLTILAGSYAAACVFAVTETTAYNFDEPYDWPEPDWRERFFHLLWFGWCFVLALALVLLPASLAEDPATRWRLIAIGVAVLFPVFALSMLEANSLWPFSGPIWRSLFANWPAWIVFYLVSGTILFGSGFATLSLYRRLGLLSVVMLAPLWAACILWYARLLGRLAWRIMEPEPMQLQAWRKAHESKLAADARKKLREEAKALED